MESKYFMGRIERERERERREQLRRRRLKLAKLLGGFLLAVILLVWIISAISGLFAPKGDEKPEISSDPSESVPAIIVNTGGSPEPSASEPANASEPTNTPEPAQLSDPLLVLVNADTPLPEDWQVTLETIAGEEQIDARAYDSLAALLNAAAQDGVTLWIASGYRSVELQQSILDRAIEQNVANGMTEEKAREDALHTINRPGHSEHHTGLAVDFNDVDDGFEETEAYYWLSEHAAEYGFVQRYRQSKVEFTGIDNESWHYRYVGKEHAEEMERLDLCLEEYVAYLKNS